VDFHKIPLFLEYDVIRVDSKFQKV
jgi:hypothetical protein